MNIEKATIVAALEAVSDPGIGVTEDSEGTIIAYGTQVYWDDQVEGQEGWWAATWQMNHEIAAKIGDTESGYMIDDADDLATLVAHVTAQTAELHGMHTYTYTAHDEGGDRHIGQEWGDGERTVVAPTLAQARTLAVEATVAEAEAAAGCEYEVGTRVFVRLDTCDGEELVQEYGGVHLTAYGVLEAIA